MPGAASIGNLLPIGIISVASFASNFAQEIHNLYEYHGELERAGLDHGEDLTRDVLHNGAVSNFVADVMSATEVATVRQQSAAGEPINIVQEPFQTLPAASQGGILSKVMHGFSNEPFAAPAGVYMNDGGRNGAMLTYPGALLQDRGMSATHGNDPPTKRSLEHENLGSTSPPGKHFSGLSAKLLAGTVAMVDARAGGDGFQFKFPTLDPGGSPFPKLQHTWDEIMKVIFNPVIVWLFATLWEMLFALFIPCSIPLVNAFRVEMLEKTEEMYNDAALPFTEGMPREHDMYGPKELLLQALMWIFKIWDFSCKNLWVNQYTKDREDTPVEWYEVTDRIETWKDKSPRSLLALLAFVFWSIIKNDK